MHWGIHGARYSPCASGGHNSEANKRTRAKSAKGWKPSVLWAQGVREPTKVRNEGPVVIIQVNIERISMCKGQEARSICSRVCRWRGGLVSCRRWNQGDKGQRTSGFVGSPTFLECPCSKSSEKNYYPWAMNLLTFDHFLTPNLKESVLLTILVLFGSTPSLGDSISWVLLYRSPLLYESSILHSLIICPF